MGNPIRPEMAPADAVQNVRLGRPRANFEDLTDPTVKLRADLDWFRQGLEAKGIPANDRRARAWQLKRIAEAQEEINAYNTEERRQAAGGPIAQRAQAVVGGATFGTDILTAGIPALVPGGQSPIEAMRDVATRRELLREEAPGEAFGLEMAGSLLNAGRFLAPAAKGAGLVERAARTVGEGAIQGGIVGATNNPQNPLGGLAAGAIGGGVAAGALGGAGASARHMSTRFSPSRASAEVAPALGRVADPARQRLSDVLAEAQSLGRGNDITLAEALDVAVGPEVGTGALRASRTLGGTAASKVVDPVFRGRMSRVGQDTRRAIEESVGRPAEDQYEAFSAMRNQKRTLADVLSEQAATEGRGTLAAMQAGREGIGRVSTMQPALPAPGQSMSARRGMPRVQDIEGDMAWPGVPSRRPRETVSQEMAREALETRRPSRMSPEGERPVELRAANDVNVRRPFPEPEAPPATPLNIPERSFGEIEARMQAAAQDPNVAAEVAYIRQDATIPAISAGRADDYTLMSEAFKNINGRIRQIEDALDPSNPFPPNNASDLVQQVRGYTASREKLRAALEGLSPEGFPKFNEQYRQMTGVERAFEEGRDVLGQAFSSGSKVTPGEVRAKRGERMATSPDELEAFERGGLARLRKMTMEGPNPDLGDAAPFVNTTRTIIGTEGKGETLRAMFGDEPYDKMVPRLRAILGEISTANAVMGNSQTADKLLEAASHLGVSPGHIVGGAASLASGSIIPAVGQIARGTNPEFGRRFRQFIEAPTATQRARILSTMGTDNINAMLDEIIAASRAPETLTSKATRQASRVLTREAGRAAGGVP